MTPALAVTIALGSAASQILHPQTSPPFRQRGCLRHMIWWYQIMKKIMAMTLQPVLKSSPIFFLASE